MNDFNIIISVIAFMVLSLGMVKNLIKKSILSEPMISMIVGICIGPVLLNWINPEEWKNSFEILHQASRYTLALAIMASALRLPHDYLKVQKRPYLTVLIGGMILMTIFTSVFYFLFGFSFWESILLGAILSPTDPVLATTIVSSSYANENIPEHLRNLITAESASNDGLAYVIVLLPLYMIGVKDEPVLHWLTSILLWENIGAIIAGAALGYLIGRVYRYVRIKKAMEPKTILAMTLSVTVLIVTSFSLFGMNGIIGIFAAGIFIDILAGDYIEVRQENVHSMIERLFVVPVFVLLGTLLPWSEWFEMPLYIWIVTPLVIFLRRIPTFFIIRPMTGTLSLKDAFFAGWFGPVGVAAIFYITLLIIDYPEHKVLWPIVSYAVVLSTILHAMSANPISKFLYSPEGKKQI